MTNIDIQFYLFVFAGIVWAVREAIHDRQASKRRKPRHDTR